MKKPAGWSGAIADALAFDIHVFTGWKVFVFKEQSLVESFIYLVQGTKTTREFLQKIHSGKYYYGQPLYRIKYYITEPFLGLLFKGIKKGEALTSKEIQGSWQRHLTVITMSSNTERAARKRGTEPKTTPESILETCKAILDTLQDMFGDRQYDSQSIKYFYYLSQKHIQTIRGSLEN